VQTITILLSPLTSYAYTEMNVPSNTETLLVMSGV